MNFNKTRLSIDEICAKFNFVSFNLNILSHGIDYYFFL